MRSSIRTRKVRRKIKRDFDLQLTSMMDVLIILVLFLLKSYALNSVAFATSSNIKLPTSTAQEAPTDSLNLIVELDGIVFDNDKVLTFTGLPGTYEMDPKQLSDGGNRILPLFDAMVRAKEKAELIMSKATWLAPKPGGGLGERVVVPPKFQGMVVIQADKLIRYDLLRRVMYTAGAAGYKTFKLVTVRKDAD